MIDYDKLKIRFESMYYEEEHCDEYYNGEDEIVIWSITKEDCIELMVKAFNMGLNHD